MGSVDNLHFDYNDFQSDKSVKTKEAKVHGKSQNINSNTINKIKSFGSFVFKLMVGGIIGTIAGAGVGAALTAYSGGTGIIAIPICAVAGAIGGIALVVSGIGIKTLLKKAINHLLKDDLDLKNPNSKPNFITKAIDLIKDKFFHTQNLTFYFSSSESDSD